MFRRRTALLRSLIGGLALVGLVAVAAGAQGDLDDARARAEAATQAVLDAQRELNDAQLRVEQAVAAAEEANAVAFDLDVAIDVLDTRVVAMEIELGDLQRSVQAIAVERYIRGDLGQLAPPNFDDPYEQAQAEALGRLVIYGTEDEVDLYRATRVDLDSDRLELASRRAEQTEALTRLEASHQRLDDGLADVAARVATLEEQEARWESEVSRLEEEERRRIEAARRAAEEAERQRLEAERLEREQATTTTSSPPPTAAPATDDPAPTDTGDSDADDDTGDDPDGEPDSTTAAPETTAAPTTAPPTTAPAQTPGSNGAVCPIAGATSFTDTWGAARSGGRSHKGVDMFAARGTPIVAHVSGRVTHSNSRLGGMQYFLYGDDGNRYFGSHLNAFGEKGQVSQGTVIGYVGSTGNAPYGSPHLHFEVHPGGGSAVNPTPYVRQACG